MPKKNKKKGMWQSIKPAVTGAATALTITAATVAVLAAWGTFGGGEFFGSSEQRASQSPPAKRSTILAGTASDGIEYEVKYSNTPRIDQDSLESMLNHDMTTPLTPGNESSEIAQKYRYNFGFVALDVKGGVRGFAQIFYVSDDGLALVNYHTIEHALGKPTKMTLFSEMQGNPATYHTTSADIQYFARGGDLAILKARSVPKGSVNVPISDELPHINDPLFYHTWGYEGGNNTETKIDPFGGIHGFFEAFASGSPFKFPARKDYQGSAPIVNLTGDDKVLGRNLRTKKGVIDYAVAVNLIGGGGSSGSIFFDGYGRVKGMASVYFENGSGGFGPMTKLMIPSTTLYAHMQALASADGQKITR